jgi:hypothetical protein
MASKTAVQSPTYPVGKTLRQLIDERVNDIEALLSGSEGELTHEIEVLLDQNTAATERKVENVARVIFKLEAECKVIDEEIARLRGRMQSRLRQIDYLKNSALADALLRLEKDRIDTPFVSVRMQLNNPRLNGTLDAAVLYHEGVLRGFIDIETVYTIDKVRLLAAAKLDAALLPEGVTIVRDESVRIA